METLQITKENAIKAYTEGTAEQKELLKNMFGKKVFLKDVFERITTFEDVLEDQGIKGYTFNEQYEGLLSISGVGFDKCKLIVKVLNEGWTVDVTDKNQKKYYIYWNMSPFSSLGVHYHYYLLSVPARLCFKDEKTAKHAAKYFEKEFKEYYVG